MQLQIEDLEPIALGALLLGSGGGGCPAVNLLNTRYQLQQQGAVELIECDELDDEALVLPIGCVGAPLVAVERIARGDEFDRVVKLCEKTLGRKVDALVCTEIGGGNALAPFATAARLGRPLVDGDTIGRAFPELQMTTPHLFGLPISPIVVCGTLSDEESVLQVDDSLEAERQVRELACRMGFESFVGMYPMSGKQAKEVLVRGSIRRALTIGRAILSANSIGSLLEEIEANLLASGMIIDVEQRLEEGFVKGAFTLEDGTKVIYQNEYLAAFRDGTLLGATPTILMLIEQDSLQPIPSERLRYGLRVHLIAFDGPEVWSTDKGLALVGPQVFGVTP